MHDTPKKAYVIAVDMGYGHQRAAYPLLEIAATPAAWNLGKPSVIAANDYPTIPRSDKFKWLLTRKLYEGISRFQGFPLFGNRAFRLMSYFEQIGSFYPKRDLSASNFPVRLVHWLVRHGFGKHLIDTLNENPLPMICTYPIPAIAAEEHGYRGDIYCLATDTDAARAWVPRHPKTSRIVYLAPTLRTRERLKLYGVRAENIVITGFPLPRENSETALTERLKSRIAKLDPSGAYRKRFEKLLSVYVDKNVKKVQNDGPLSVTFAIGGAGAQSDIAISVLTSFAEKIREGRMRLNLVAGASMAVLQKFQRAVRRLSLESYTDGRISILYNPDKYEYFRQFNALLFKTDILWTKPSELSFYAGLGLPIVMTPPLGSQEEFNQAWLHMMGAGFEEYDPRYASEWLFDWIESGWLAEAAVNGFLNVSRDAVDRISDLVLHGKKNEAEDVHFA